MEPRAALDHEIVDVFAPRPFAGNALAVVFDADELPFTVTATAGVAIAAAVAGAVVPVGAGRIRVP